MLYNSLRAFRDRLDKYISEGSMTKSEFCEKTGIDRGRLDKYLKEQMMPKIDVLDKVSEVMGIKPWQLIQTESEKNLRDTIIPNELFEALKKLPPEKAQKVGRLFAELITEIKNSE